MEEILVRYLHFMGIIFLSSSLVLLHMSTKIQMQKDEFRRVKLFNYFYLSSIVVVVLSGMILWLFVGKPEVLYSKNWVFHLKITIVLLLIILSCFFTYYLNKASKNNDAYLSKSILNIINIELLLLIFIPLCAVFMAHGYGYYG